MPRSLVLGNGSTLICFDRFGQVKDFYYHYAGLENHVSEHFIHKIGVFVDGKMSWIDGGDWNTQVTCDKDSMLGRFTAVSENLGLTVSSEDVVYNEKDIFIRSIKLENHFDARRKVTLFLNQQFNISQTHTGETAYFDPREKVIIHYKGRRVFLVNAISGGKSFSQYSVGLLGIEGKGGTFLDAEDGELSANPIEHGQVDSVIGIDVDLDAKQSEKVDYWIVVAKSLETAKKLNSYVLERGPEKILKSTYDYWYAWVHNQNFSFYGMSDAQKDLFNRSLIIMRTHVSKNGAIIASGDSEMLKHGRDTYSYVWTRDAAIVSKALAKAGDFNASKKFFEYCVDVVSPEGYFMHKYRPDGSLGSSWHPWIRNGNVQLPIQEDETALVIDALWTFFELSKDLEFIEQVYKPLIKIPAEFMVEFRDISTGLPLPTYDLWEEKFGVHTFTASSVYRALSVAGKFAKLLGKTQSASQYYTAAKEVKDAIVKNLYDEEDGYFYKMLEIGKEAKTFDKTMDMSSLYGIWRFEVLSSDDEKFVRAKETMMERLSVNTGIGGLARYEGDHYHKRNPSIPGNPWIITHLWNTQLDIEKITKEEDLAHITRQFDWVCEQAANSGVLPEQVDPETKEPLSSAPLVWSHAEYVISVVEYLEKLESLGICKACYPLEK